MDDNEQAILDARRLLRARKEGVLSTISKRVEGWPFGSVAPYALDRLGRPIIFISTIAEHTKNVIADPRTSLLVQEDPSLGDVQANARITLMGRAERVPEPEIRDARARYLSRVPSAESHAEAHDFEFWRLPFAHVRFIGGFGRIHWLDAESLTLDPARDPLARAAGGILAHMNEDHADAILSYCRAFKSVSPASAKMVGVDQYGFDVECMGPDARLRFDFDVPATPATIREIVVDMAKRARSLLPA